MKQNLSILLFIIVGLMSYAFSNDSSQVNKEDSPDEATKLQAQVGEIFKKDCATAGCHRGNYPKKKLNLEQEKFVQALVDVPSIQIPSIKLVDTKQPEKSYLLIKVRGDEGIVDNIMPVEAPPLKQDEINILEKWVASLKQAEKQDDASKTEDAEKKKINSAHVDRDSKSAFDGTCLINLPTTRAIGKHDVLFRVSHRFYPPVSSGYDSYFGLNGPAAILISLGYGVTDNVSVSLGHVNSDHEYELGLDWLIFKQRGNFPLSVMLSSGGSLITQKLPGEKIFCSENLKFNVLLSLSRQINNSASLLLAPMLATNTNTSDPSTENTIALGIGGHYRIVSDISIIAEWVPILSGFYDEFDGFGIGLEYKVGGHVFQAFMTNTYGLTTDQYIAGGDLDIAANDYRLGFNIFRSFWF